MPFTYPGPCLIINLANLPHHRQISQKICIRRVQAFFVAGLKGRDPGASPHLVVWSLNRLLAHTHLQSRGFK